MGAYFITIAISLAFAGLAEYKQGHTLQHEKRLTTGTKILLALALGALIFTAGLRYYIGADYGGYYRWMESDGTLLKRKILELDEPGLHLLAALIRPFTDDGAYFIFACSLITILLFMVPTLKYTDNFFFVMALFIFTGTWHGAFNGVRQFLAAAILFAGHRLIFERKFWKYLLVVFLAFLVHRSAAVGIVFYFIFANRISIINVILLLVGTYLVSANFDAIFQFIGLLKDEEVNIDQITYFSNTVNIFRVLVACAPAVYVIVLYFRKNPDKEKTFYINVLLANAASMLATANSAYLARVNIYTNAFVPLALSKLIKFDNKAKEGLVKVGIIILYAIFWYIDITNSKVLSPFHWIWER